MTQLPPPCGPVAGLRLLTTGAEAAKAAGGAPTPDLSGPKRVGVPLPAAGAKIARGMVGVGAFADGAVEVLAAGLLLTGTPTAFVGSPLIERPAR